MDAVLAIQAAGLLAVAIELVIYQINRRSVMLILDLCSALLWVLHYCLLGGWTGAAMNGVRATRAYFFRWNVRHWCVPLVFMLLAGAGTLLSWEGPISLLPLTGIVIGTAGFWQQNPAHIRVAVLVCSVPWFVYNFLTISYPGMLLEALLACSTLAGICRLDLVPWLRGRRPLKVLRGQLGAQAE